MKIGLYFSYDEIIMIFPLLIITFCAMGESLWNTGGIFLLDFVVGETGVIHWYNTLSQSMVILLGRVFGYEIASKIIIFLIHLYSGYLGILYARYLGHLLRLDKEKNQRMLDIIGILFFIMNPFAYERMLTQPLIYAGIICIGYGIYWMLFEEKYWRAGFAYAIALSIFPHASYMILIVGILFLFFLKGEISRLRVFAMMFLPIFLLNLNWLSSFYLGKITNTVHSFSGENFLAFSTQALSPLDIFSTNILLYGFWGEKYDNHFAVINDISPYWFIAGFLIFIIVIFGYRILWKKGLKRIVRVFVILGFLSLIFAIGRGSEYTSHIEQFLIEYIPYWQGYREPQKWTGVLFLVESVGFISAIAFFLKKWGNDAYSRWSILLCTFIVLYIWSPGVLFSYRGQMQTTRIPNDFYEVRNLLLERSDTKSILILPWHGYIGCDWISRPTISHPAKEIFSTLPILLSDTVEVGEFLNDKKQESDSEVVGFEKIFPHDISLDIQNNIGYIITLNDCSGYDEIKEYIQEGENGKLSKLYKSQSISLYKYVK